MTVEYVVGDLFDLKIPVICQGTNLQGKMFAGIAKNFYQRFPQMFKEYEHGCKYNLFHLGEFMFYDDIPTGFKIYNLMTQPYPGPCASLMAIYNSLLNMGEHADSKGFKEIAMPRIGSGLGGLPWEKVKEKIELASERINAKLIVCSLV